jgi:capsular exopolysaccharide synthesis family protein
MALQTEEVDVTMSQDGTPTHEEGRSDWLRRSEGQPLAVAETNRDWLFPGVDEVFRGIYTRAGLGFASEVIAVCSSIAGEGKTTVSVGLGVTLAQDFPDSRILLVETDMRSPVLASDFDVAPTPGLVDCMFSGAPVQDAFRRTFLENLHVVPVGGPINGAGRILRSIRMASAVDAMRQTHDIIILDIPPILVNSDAVLLTDLSDGIVFIVRTGVTPLDVINKGISQLDAEKLRGVVLNGADSSVPGWLRRLWAE